MDLPAPLRPVSAIASPVRTSRLNLSKMVFGPEGPAQAGHLENRRAFGHGGDSASFRQEIRTNLSAAPPAVSRRRHERTHGKLRGHQSRVLAATNSSRGALCRQPGLREAPMTTISIHRQRVAAEFLSSSAAIVRASIS